MNPIQETIKKVKDTITRYHMLDPGDRVIVAVSGGPDSICLLDVLQTLKDELRIKLVVAHFNHRLRPSEDEAETQFVRHLASSLNLPFETENASLLSQGEPGSVEEKARNVRYAFLERLRNRLGAQKIAVGHNLNDQAETVLMRLLRGGGPSGLSGIPPCRDDTIIRPLIEVKREEIEAYLKARELSYVTDSSNIETRYLRNRIRLELLPRLVEEQPRIVEHLGQLAVILREDNEFLENEAQTWVEREAELKNNGDVLIPISPFVELPPAVRGRVTRNILMRRTKTLRRIDYRHLESVYKLAQSQKPQGRLDLPNGVSVKRIYDRLAFSVGVDQKPQVFHYVIEGLGTYTLEQIGRSITLTELRPDADLDLGDSEWTAYLDADKLRYPLIVRSFRSGDRFIALGMAGHKKIKDFFIDLKFPLKERASVPILVSGDTPVWICGHRIDERFKVTANTKRILKVSMT